MTGGPPDLPAINTGTGTGAAPSVCNCTIIKSGRRSVGVALLLPHTDPAAAFSLKVIVDVPPDLENTVPNVGVKLQTVSSTKICRFVVKTHFVLLVPEMSTSSVISS